MIQQHIEKIKDSVKNGLNTLQQAVNNQYNTPSFIPSTLDLQIIKKSGWIKKSRGVLKGWQTKWFVLKGDYLLYYSSAEDNKQPQGVIFMPGNIVSERDGKSTDAGKYIIDILQDSSSLEGNQVLVESLSAESLEERASWIMLFKSLLYASIGGAIFGSDLGITLKFEKCRQADRSVPEIVELCVEYLEKQALKEEGLFRLAGRKKIINKYVEMFDRGLRPQFEGEVGMDIHSVASLLKFYLIRLPSSLIPSSHYETIIGLVTRGIQEDTTKSMARLQEELRSIHTHNYTLLKYMSSFLHTVSTESHFNKMTTSNLAVIFSNIFIRPSDESADLMLLTGPARNSVTQLLIENEAWLFNMEVTTFGGCVVVEDLLGLVVVNVNTDGDFDGGGKGKEDWRVGGLGLNRKEEGDGAVNTFSSDLKGFDYLQNGEVRNSTLCDLMGLNFSGSEKGWENVLDMSNNSIGEDEMFVNRVVKNYMVDDKDKIVLFNEDDKDDTVVMRNIKKINLNDLNRCCDGEIDRSDTSLCIDGSYRACLYNENDNCDSEIDKNSKDQNNDDTNTNNDDDDDDENGDVVLRSRGEKAGDVGCRRGVEKENEDIFSCVKLGFKRSNRVRVRKRVNLDKQNGKLE